MAFNLQLNKGVIAARVFLAVIPALLLISCRNVSQEEIATPAQLPAAAAAPTIDDAAVRTQIDRILESGEHPALKWKNLRDVVNTLKAAYAEESDRLLWFDGGQPSSRAREAVNTVARAGEYGLDATDYDSEWLSTQWQAISARSAAAGDVANFDLALSIAAARMARAVHAGRVDPTAMNWGYEAAAKTTDVAAALSEARTTQDLNAVLIALEPKFNHYRRAKAKLALYKKVLEAGEPPLVPALPTAQTKIAPEKPWAGVPQLVARLKAFGDLAESDAQAIISPGGETTTAAAPVPIYTGELVNAVRRFQQRHGLGSDAVIGMPTIRALNVPIANRIRQIELAMERGRWLPDLSAKPNVFVNVALFRMWATDPKTGEEPLRMNVVVGKALNTQTPIFVDQMEYVIFRPYWNPPPSIVRGEIIPALRKNPAYLDSQNMEIVSSGADNAPTLPVNEANIAALASGRLTVRQRPGPRNALGLAKFIFPNSNNVYMHGTPAQALFSRIRRDFSHGCIRVEDPTRFAEWVLRDNPSWTRERIEAAMNGDRPTQVNLKEKLTVVVFYDTVHVNSEEIVFFVDDIYGHDKSLDAALRRGYPFPSKQPEL